MRGFTDDDLVGLDVAAGDLVVVVAGSDRHGDSGQALTAVTGTQLAPTGMIC